MPKVQSNSRRTYERVAITQASAGWTVIKALVSGKPIYLHELFLKSDAGGTVTIQSADDSNGTNAAALTGAIPVGAVDTVRFSQGDHVLCLRSPAGKSLGLTSGTAKVFGYAVVSY